MEVPEPLATELGLKVHAGARVTAGVMLLQDRLTVPLKPFIGVMVIVERADAPAEIVAGGSGGTADHDFVAAQGAQHGLGSASHGGGAATYGSVRHGVSLQSSVASLQARTTDA